MRNNIKAFFPILFLIVNIANAAPITLDFRAAPVSEVVQVLIGEILHFNYVMSSDVEKLEKRVTVSILGISAENLMLVIEGILSTCDVKMKEVNGVYFIELFSASKSTPSSQGFFGAQSNSLSFNNELAKENKEKELSEITSYRPRGRSIEFLRAVAKSAGVTVMDFNGKELLNNNLTVYSWRDTIIP
jgi:hypothetical protein